MNLQEWIYRVLPELQCSMVWVPGAQNIIRAILRELLKDCFADSPPVQLDPHQQLTGMSSDQMI